MDLKTLFFVFCIMLCLGCKDEKKQIENNESILTTNNLQYATGFSLTKTNQATIIQIKNPWQKASKTYSYALATKAQQAAKNFNSKKYTAVITVPIKKIVVTSTTHIPALELLQEENTLIGFPGTDYISSKKTRIRINKNEVIELGKNQNINTEILLNLQPDVIVGFALNHENKSLELVQKSGIPVIYNGDWLEKTPLAKAEWIKLFGALYQKEEKADSIFKNIESNYLKAKKIAAQAIKKPTVLSGAMYKDIWYLPSGFSSEAQILKDANVNYLWHNTKGTGSLELSFETVFNKAKDANIWLNPSNYKSLKALQIANSHYTKFNAFKNKQVFTSANTTGETGGVLYFELGTARPDLVLKDVIKICHKNLLPNYKTVFFKPLP